VVDEERLPRIARVQIGADVRVCAAINRDRPIFTAYSLSLAEIAARSAFPGLSRGDALTVVAASVTVATAPTIAATRTASENCARMSMTHLQDIEVRARRKADETLSRRAWADTISDLLAMSCQLTSSTVMDGALSGSRPAPSGRCRGRVEGIRSPRTRPAPPA
jgi:hypothetical protein